MNSKPLSMLLIEDDPGFRDFVVQMLSEPGNSVFHIEQSQTLGEGFDVLNREKVDVVLLDLILPDNEGINTFSLIKEKHPDLPIVILTSLEDEKMAVEAVKNGAQDYLFKMQVKGDVLIRSLRYAVERKRVQEELQHARDEMETRVSDRTKELKELNNKLKEEIEERRRALESLAASEERFRGIAERSFDMIFEIGIKRQFLYTSPAVGRIFGYEPDEITNIPIEAFISEEDKKRVTQSLDTLLAGSHIEGVQCKIIKKGGCPGFIEINASPILRDGKVTGGQGIARDVTERKKMEEELWRLSITDSLTNLFNQRHFYTKINEEASRAKRMSYSLCLMVFDLDNFKKYNDKHGHLAGDTILKHVGEITANSIRKDVDTAFRYGGDEFAIILPSANKSDAATVAKRIRNSIRSLPSDIDISLGIASFNDHANITSMINAADRAMYAQKEAKK
jgi:diguanylate cyclase (GGDEF)-like protein/PAS domain S-box-containing protein